MKKVGVLTFHRAYNFGAALQAYALQYTIEKNGYKCQIIDYRNPKIEKWFHNATLKVKIKNFLKYVLYHSYSIQVQKRGKRFKKFALELMNLSKVYLCAGDFKDAYDAVVVGSDQVWNLEMTGGDMNFFLPYRYGACKLTYSASFGKSTVNNIYKDEVKSYLLSFESLFIREQDGVRLVQALSGQPATKTADPTLLLDKDEWTKVSKPIKTSGKYILLYLVAEQTNAIEVAKKMAAEKDCEVIMVDPPRKSVDGVRNLIDVGPSEFLYLIANAECVITTSFHGLILSINHNTPFLFELSNKTQNTNSRLIEVNNTYDLEKYRITTNDICNYIDVSYDWDLINEKIFNERKESLDKLLGSLSQVGENKSE